MRLSFLTGSSCLRIRILPEGGGRLPHGRLLGASLPLSVPPPSAPSHPVSPNSLLMQGVSISEV